MSLAVVCSCGVQCWLCTWAAIFADTHGWTLIFWEHSPFGQLTLKMHSPGLVFTRPKRTPAFESQAAFGFFFLSFPLQGLLEPRKYTSTFWQGITSHFQTYQRNTHWSKTIQVQRPQAHGRSRVITSMKNASLRPYTPRNHNRGIYSTAQNYANLKRVY